MKYLKLFEDIHSYYEVINEYDWYDTYNIDNLESFTDFEKVEISKFFPVGEIYYSYFDPLSHSSKRCDATMVISLVRDDCYNLSVLINKTKDEWYYVSYLPRSAKEMGAKFFKCDQFDGLIKFLEEKKLGRKLESK